MGHCFCIYVQLLLGNISHFQGCVILCDWESCSSDKANLDGANITTTRPSWKLSYRHLGPFRVERKVRSNAYRLKLPLSMSRIHPVFNVIKLTPIPTDPFVRRHAPPPPLPKIVNGMGGGRNAGQQNGTLETLLPGKIKGLWYRTQVLGTLGQCPRPRIGSRILT